MDVVKPKSLYSAYHIFDLDQKIFFATPLPGPGTVYLHIWSTLQCPAARGGPLPVCWKSAKNRLLGCFHERQNLQKLSDFCFRKIFHDRFNVEGPALGLVRDGRRMEIPLHNSRTNHSNTLQNGDIYMLSTTTTYLDHRESW